MSAKPLTKKETSWLERLEKVMQACPSDRLSCYTTGDNDLTFYDKNVESAWSEANPGTDLDAGDLHEAAGSYLCRIVGVFNIDSCAG